MSLGARASRPHKTWQGRGDWLHRVGRFTRRLTLEQRLDKYAGGTPALPGGNPWLARCRSLSRALFCRSILPPSHARLRILQKAPNNNRLTIDQPASVPSLNPSCCTGIHWTIQDVRGQVFRLINPGVTTSGAVEWGGNLRVLPLGNRRFCFRHRSMSLGKSRQSRPLLHQRIGFRRRRIYSRGGNLRRGTISIFLTTPSPVRHRFRSGAIRAFLPSTMLAMTTLLHAPTITLMRSSLRTGRVDRACDQPGSWQPPGSQSTCK